MCSRCIARIFSSGAPNGCVIAFRLASNWSMSVMLGTVAVSYTHLDVELFAFTDSDEEPDTAPLLEFCARVVLVRKPRYREPRWSTVEPPEVHEFQSPAMQQALTAERGTFDFQLLQVEYTHLAS